MARKAAFESNYDNTEATGALQLDPTPVDGPGFRETIESIAVAIILAMIFKVLEAEAYIIPTGSMAPSLMGQHAEVQCDDCYYWFQSGASSEGPGQSNTSLISEVRCPMCSKRHELTRQFLKSRGRQQWSDSEYDANEESFSGDRIVVSKVEYVFREPRRWDVIVFKYPGGAKTNYIKRLLGLPGEAVVTNNGDIFTQQVADLVSGKNAKAPRTRMVARKPPEKLAHIAFPVSDTKYFSRAMRTAGLLPSWQPQSLTNDQPETWSNYSVDKSAWESVTNDDTPATFTIKSGSGDSQKIDWLRFRHQLPTQDHWKTALAGGQLPQDFIESPGSLVTDQYCYNDSQNISIDGQGAIRDYPWDNNRLSINWVGDLLMEAELKLDDSQGTIALDAVEGGVHFLCKIDVATGVAKLSAVIADPDVKISFADDTSLENFSKQEIEFPTSIQGAGSYKIRYGNCDDRIYLWINDTSVPIPADGCYLRDGKVRPFYSTGDPADAQPLAIGVSDCAATIQRLKVDRDLYYLDPVNMNGIMPALRRRGNLVLPSNSAKGVFLRPDVWNDDSTRSLFDVFSTETQLDWDRSFRLTLEQYFPMGDNSPQSSDARIWNAPKYVERRFMIGKALIVYWPHTWNSPRFWPNFRRMRLIH